MHTRDNINLWMRYASVDEQKDEYCVIEQVHDIINECRQKMSNANNLTVYYTDSEGHFDNITMDGYLYDPIVYELIKRNYAPCVVVQHYTDREDACTVRIEKGGGAE